MDIIEPKEKAVPKNRNFICSHAPDFAQVFHALPRELTQSRRIYVT